MARSALSSEQVLQMLAEAPGRIAAQTAGLPPALLQAKARRDAWSANEVLAHMRACADMWGGSAAAIVAAQDRPTLRAINPRTWIKTTDYLEQDFRRSLRAYTAQRSKLLALLEPLAPEGWARAATVTGAGAPLERTVLFYAQWLARHERPHLKQIEAIANSLGQSARGRTGAASR